MSRTNEDSRSAPASNPRDSGAMDDALAVLAGTGPEYSGGFANHAPMAAEALVAMGRDRDVVPWVESYRARLEPPPQRREPIDATRWRDSLGDPRRASDWTAHFERALAEQPWRDVLDAWALRFAPGAVAAAAHGLLRTAHAARSLAARDTPLRRRELADGLAYWASTYAVLPTASAASRGRANAAEAIASVETLRPAKHLRHGFITEGLKELDHLPSFASVADALDVSGDLASTLSDVTTAFAHVYLANADSSGRRVTFVHTVTGPSALRLLLPHVAPGTARTLLRYAWQAAAGMYAAFGERGSPESKSEPPDDLESLVEGAVQAADEHAIKMAEACLREHAVRPDPVYLAAAAHAVEHLRI